MALRKPSDLLDKKEDSGVFKSPEVTPHITESYNKFVDNFETVNEIAEKTKVFEKVDELSERVEFLSKELSEKLTRTDLENAMLSQLMVLDENFKTIQSQVKGLNKKDLKEFKETVYNLSQVVDNLVESELPKYKKQVVKNKLFVGEQIKELQGIVIENITGIREEIDEKFDNIAEVIDNNLEYFNNQLKETSSQVKKTTETYTNLSKIVENKVSKENETLKEYGEIVESLTQAFEELSYALKEELNTSSKLTEEKFEKYRNQFENISSGLEKSIDNRLEDYRKELVGVKAEVAINEQHIKNVDKYLQDHHQDLEELKEEVFNEIEKLPVGNLQENFERLEKKIDFIKETYSKIEPDVVVKEVIGEGLLNEPPSSKNSDPLTPLDQNFVTLDQLQQHYRLFLNRIQQQISTFGGGGETQLKYLDDIVGIATNASAYDGKFLTYNNSIGKFEFVTVSGGGGSQDLNDVLQLGNTSSLGMSVGIVTASEFVGNLSGNATTATTAYNATIADYASVSGISTALQNPRTFEITGDIVASPVSFDGTGNVSFAATIQPNSVGLGTDTTGDYVQSISGTTNQIVVTGGDGEGSTPVLTIPSQFTAPQDVTVTRDLQVNRNLNVNGNITIGGTTASLFTSELKIYDPDIVLGVRTDGSGNDISTDNTANHGGIAIASTEGTPLVELYVVGVGETNPSTYKKFMWFKSGTFSGLGTDAWLSNYAIGIGSTQFPVGTRLAAGSVQFTEQDLSVVRNINSTGIVTSSQVTTNQINVGTGVTIYGSSGIVSTTQLYINSFPVNQSYTLSHTTGSLGVGATADFTISAGNAFHLLSVTSSTPAWIRVYGTSSGRSSDTRTSPGGTLPSSGSEYYAELVTTTTPQTIRLSPVPIVQGTNSEAFIRVINTDTVSRTIQLNFKVITIED